MPVNTGILFMKLIANILFTGLIVINLCFYSVPFFENGYLLAEPVLAGLVGLMLCFCWFRKVSFTKLDVAIVLLLLYISVRALLTNYRLNREVVILFCFYLLYFIVRYIGSKFEESRFSAWLLTYMLVSIGIAFLMMCFNSFDKAGNIPFVPNKSIWCILIASQIVFIIPLLKGQNRLLQIACALASIVLLFYANGRAGWIGLLAGICIIIILNSNSREMIKRNMLISICSILLVCFSLLFYKSDSSSGRILIYKVTATVIQKNWLAGVGFGKFKAVYNEYQADYFTKHNIDGKEALLADNTYYAFNDLLQFVAETGIIGLVILGFTVFYLLEYIIKLRKVKLKPLHISAIAAIVVLVIGSIFSYSFTVLPVLIQLIICASIITQIGMNDTSKLQSYSFNLAKYVVALCLFSYCFGLISFNNEIEKAKELSRAGFKNKALEKYKALSASLFVDGQLLLSFAKELNYANQINEADSMLSLSKQYLVNNDTYSLSASIKSEQRKHEEAEKDYLRAIYMVPNRMLARYNLMQFYLGSSNKKQAIYWGNSILNMKVKVASDLTQLTQQKVRGILSTLR